MVEEKIDLSIDNSGYVGHKLGMKEQNRHEETNQANDTSTSLKSILKISRNAASISSIGRENVSSSLDEEGKFDLSKDHSMLKKIEEYNEHEETNIESQNPASYSHVRIMEPNLEASKTRIENVHIGDEHSITSFPSFSQQKTSLKQFERKSSKKPKVPSHPSTTCFGLNHKETVVFCLVWINITGAVLSYKFYDTFSTMMTGNTLFMLINFIDQNYIKSAFYFTVVLSYCSGSAGFRYVWHNAQIANAKFEKDHIGSLMRQTVSGGVRKGRQYIMRRAIWFIIIIFVTSDVILFFDESPYEYPPDRDISLRKWLTIPIQALGFGFAQTLTIQEFGVIPMVFT